MRPGKFFLGLILILAGTIFFLINLGYGSWSILRLLPQFWPLLLIIFGLSLLWKGPIPPWFAFSLILVITTAIIFLFVTSNSEINSQSFLEEKEIKKEIVIDHEYPNLSFGELTVQFGAGRILIEPTSDQLWVKAHCNKDDVISEYSVISNQLKVDFRLKGQNYPRSVNDHLWRLALSPQLNWRIHLKTGAAKGDLNLVGIPLPALTLHMGAGDFDLVLGNNGGHSKVKINAGASNLKIKVHEEDGVRIRIGGALKSTNLDTLHWVKRGSEYISPNYETAQDRIEVDLDLAVGHFELETITTGSLLDKAEEL